METKPKLIVKQLTNQMAPGQVAVAVGRNSGAHQVAFTVFLFSSFFHERTELISCTAGNNIAFESHRVQP